MDGSLGSKAVPISPSGPPPDGLRPTPRVHLRLHRHPPRVLAVRTPGHDRNHRALLLWAALAFSRGVLRWRRRYLLFVVAVDRLGLRRHLPNPRHAPRGISSSVALAAVTLVDGGGVLAPSPARRLDRSHGVELTFGLWGLHHLDYPLLRPLGSGILYGSSPMCCSSWRPRSGRCCSCSAMGARHSSTGVISSSSSRDCC